MYFFLFQKLRPDCKTRWSSLCEMIQSVLRIQEPFQKVTDEFVDEEFTMLKELYDALEPVRLLTIKLCSDSANLMTADVGFMETFKWLKNAKGQFSKNLHDALHER